MPAILYVCAANRIRSPLAEHLTLRRLPANPQADAWRIESAGVWAADGQPAPSAARQVAARLGLTLDAHLSRRIEDVDLAKFDRILTMERIERNTLRAAFPELAERVYMLSEAADGQEQNITDPRATVDAVMHTARRLDAMIAKALPQLLAMFAVIDEFAPAVEPSLASAYPAEPVLAEPMVAEPMVAEPNASADQHPRRLRFGVLRRQASNAAQPGTKSISQ